jgi:hypothetical protein
MTQKYIRNEHKQTNADKYIKHRESFAKNSLWREVTVSNGRQGYHGKIQAIKPPPLFYDMVEHHP